MAQEGAGPFDPLGAVVEEKGDGSFGAGALFRGDMGALMGRAGNDLYGAAPNFVGAITAPFAGGVGDATGLGGIQSLLQQRALGQGPSAAELLMQGAQDRTASMATGLARGSAGMGGVAAGAALRNAMNVGAQSGLQSQQQIGAMRAQEQMMAQQQLAQFLTQMRQQDIERQKAEAEALAKAHELQYGADSQRRGGLLSAAGQFLESIF